VKLERLAITTETMCAGMTLRHFFEEAVRSNVPGLPFVDDNNRITGRVSVRDVFKHIAVPPSIVSLAGAVGDKTDRLDMSEKKVLRALAYPVEKYVLDNVPAVSPYSSLVKALAIMEAYNTHYIFLVENHEYVGVVTRMVIAERMLEVLHAIEHNNGKLPDEEDDW
jgi:CBS domain-containing protein